MNILFLLTIPVSSFVIAKFYLIQTEGIRLDLSIFLWCHGIHYISDQAAKNNHDQKIGHDDIDNYFDSENSDYQLETGLQCRCGTELTGADHEGKDYVWGGRAVQVESFIKRLLLLPC